MTLYDLILGYGGARSLLEENSAQYYWSIEELTAYFNRAEREAAARSLCLKYRHSDDIIGTVNDDLPGQINDDICGIIVEEDVSEYEVTSNVLRIDRARLSSESIPLELKTRTQMDQIYPSWMDPANTPETPKYLISQIGKEIILSPIPDADYTLYLILSVLPKYPMAVPEYGTDFTLISSTKTITRDAGKFITNGYQAGGIIAIQGSEDNDGLYTIDSITDQTTMVVEETLTDEASAGNTIIMSSMPEIPVQYHEDLIDFVAHLALKKKGKKTEDMQKSAFHLALFEKIFGSKKVASMERALVTTPMKGGMMAKKYKI